VADPAPPTTLNDVQQRAKLQELQAKFGALLGQMGVTADQLKWDGGELDIKTGTHHQGGLIAGRGFLADAANRILDWEPGAGTTTDVYRPATQADVKSGSSTPADIAKSLREIFDQAKQYGIDDQQIRSAPVLDSQTAATKIQAASVLFQSGTQGSVTSQPGKAPATPGEKAAAPTATVGGLDLSQIGLGSSGPASTDDIAGLTRLYGSAVHPSALFGYAGTDPSGAQQPNLDVHGSVRWSPYAGTDLSTPPVQQAYSGTPTSYTLREALALPYGWSPAQVGAAAEKLWRGGFLDAGSIDPTKPFATQFSTDAYDPKFEQAYQDLIRASWADPSKTMTEILDQRTQQRAPFIQAQVTDVVNQRMAAFNWSSPARVAESTISAYENLTGKTATPEEVQAEQAQVKASDEERFKTALQTGQAGQAPDVAAEAAQAVRTEHPEDVFGKQASDELGLFRQLVGGAY
jgi:hypothetical protein